MGTPLMTGSMPLDLHETPVEDEVCPDMRNWNQG